MVCVVIAFAVVVGFDFVVIAISVVVVVVGGGAGFGKSAEEDCVTLFVDVVFVVIDFEFTKVCKI